LFPAEAAFGCAEAFENAPKPSSAIKTAARVRINPSKTRTLEKADSDGECFFMELVEFVWGSGA
jgi:hypothetical protein